MRSTRIGAVVATTLLVAGGVLAAEPAQAAVSCTYTSCDKKDPQAAGCSTDATTIFSRTLTMGTIQLRHSNACKAFWTRVTTGEVTGGRIRVTRYDSTNDANPEYSLPKDVGANATGWTAMWGESSVHVWGFQACGRNSGESTVSCTNKSWR